MRRRSLESNHDLEGGWEHLAPLHQLALLEISVAGVGDVPRALSTLGSLTSLTLRLLGADPAAGPCLEPLLAATRLRRLAMPASGLRRLPPALARLPSLHDLSLWGNRGFADWEGLARLPALAALDLSYCNLKAVPAPLTRLTCCTRLTLDANPLATGWPTLRALARLRVLSLRGCFGLDAAVTHLHAAGGLNQQGEPWQASKWRVAAGTGRATTASTLMTSRSARSERRSTMTAPRVPA